MPHPLALHEIGRLPAPGDNVAIAIRQLDPGTMISLGEHEVTLAHSVLEGHRFAVRPINEGDPLLSWGLTFGHALSAIAPGDYVANTSMLEALSVRQRTLTLPDAPNFSDHLVPFELDDQALAPALSVDPAPDERTFAGYRRPGDRGVGTRNTIVILGTTSRTASFARQLTERLQSAAKRFPSFDGIVAVAHTEGGGIGEPNNAAEILRALAGFMTHPNVGAVLAVDYGGEPINNQRLAKYLREHGYALDHVRHHFLSIEHGLASALTEGERIVRAWLPAVAADTRESTPIRALRVALQCGGSDAFSGVSGNPLAGAMVHEIVRHGGTGVLCETDELAGAEAYLMRNMRDLDVAHALLDRIAAFKERLSWHGVTPESNPSAGNKFRGLYNITLKSLGAVHKKDPRTPVDQVIDYAQPLGAPGFYIMDSPGNDLEAIGGQMASGCNLCVFVTGNGSVTNFPFVPTLKITTTTKRHQLLIHEMDINAGRYLDGESFESLTAEALDLLIATASGQRSRGERAGHSQVSLWRDWRQTDASQLDAIRQRSSPDGQPLPTPSIRARQAVQTVSTERLGLVLPTSLCSSQIARMAAGRMNARGLAASLGLSRFVALPHSEGCGFGGETMYPTLYRTYRGYATHPNVAATLLLEHGCEKVPNDAMRRQFEAAGLPLDRFGWASVQLDGGIDRTLAKIEAWFADHPTTTSAGPAPAGENWAGLNIGIMSSLAPSRATVEALSQLAREILVDGGSVLIPASDPLLADVDFTKNLLGDRQPKATLANGETFTPRGFHVVQTDSDHWVENLTALGACGAHVFLGFVGTAPQQAHPMLPVLQVAESAILPTSAHADVDALLATENISGQVIILRNLLQSATQGKHSPAANKGGFVDFQFARGPLGIST